MHLYRHLELFPRGSNLTIEVLYRMLKCLKASYNGKRECLSAFEVSKHVPFSAGNLPKVFYLQMDNCWRENKNHYVLAFLSDLVLKVFLGVCVKLRQLYLQSHRECSMKSFYPF